MSIYWNDGTELYHYGIKGQRWGDRRYQNEDGTYTEEGRRRYGIGDGRTYKKLNGTKASSGNIVSRSRKGIDVNKAKNAAKIALGVLGTAAIAGGVIYGIKKDKEVENKVFSLMEELDYRNDKMNSYFDSAESERKKVEENINQYDSIANQKIKSQLLDKAEKHNKVADKYSEKGWNQYKQAKYIEDELNKLDSKSKKRNKYNKRKESLKGVKTFTPDRFYIDRIIPD